MATIWTRRRGGCVLSATFEDRTTPCDFETKQKHTFLSEEEVSLFHSLFFVGEEKSRKIESAKKPPYSSQSAKAHSQSRRSLKKKDRRPRGMMLSNDDDDGVHFALTRFFFSLFACRPLRPPSFCARKHRMMMMMMPMSLSRRGFRALFIQTTTLGTREDDDEGEAFHAKTRAQKRRRRRRRGNQPHLISGLRSHSRSRERRGR